jgi:DTW domain-containing protein YfiP
MHVKEWCKASNTGHLARLALQNAEIRLHGLLNQTVCEEAIDDDVSSNLVLFPGRGASPLTPEYAASLRRPVTLLIPDGNWNQAKGMMGRLPMLRNAHPIRLAGSSLKLDCLRHNVRADRMSTFEAIAQALGMLEGEETEDQLLTFFRRFIDAKAARGG